MWHRRYNASFSPARMRDSNFRAPCAPALFATPDKEALDEGKHVVLSLGGLFHDNLGCWSKCWSKPENPENVAGHARIPIT